MEAPPAFSDPASASQASPAGADHASKSNCDFTKNANANTTSASMGPPAPTVDPKGTGSSEAFVATDVTIVTSSSPPAAEAEAKPPSITIIIPDENAAASTTTEPAKTPGSSTDLKPPSPASKRPKLAPLQIVNPDLDPPPRRHSSRSGAEHSLAKGWDSLLDNQFRVPLYHHYSDEAFYAAEKVRMRKEKEEKLLHEFEERDRLRAQQLLSHTPTLTAPKSVTPKTMTATPGTMAAARTGSASPTTRVVEPILTAEQLKKEEEEKRKREMSKRIFLEAVQKMKDDEDEEDYNANGLIINICQPSEPHLEIKQEASMVNAINSAYTSSGYPSVVSNGNQRGLVYGSFVDLRCISVHSLNLPPRATIIVGPCRSNANGNSSNNVAGTNRHETLLKVRWRRARHVFAAEDQVIIPKKGEANSRPTGAAPDVTNPHIIQFPEGVHGVHSSALLADLILRGKLPYEDTATAANGKEGEAPAPAAAAPGVPPTPKQGEAPTAANTPAPARRPSGTSPVQHTLVSANTFNHLSVYFVAHQDGTILFSAPVQTLSASIATRKITAQCLFMMGKEEVNPMPEVGEDCYEYNSAVTSPLMETTAGRTSGGDANNSPFNAQDGPVPTVGVSASYRKRDTVDFVRLPAPEREAEVLFRTNGYMNDQTIFVDADPKSKTIKAAYVSLVVEPLLLFGNQNGDLFVFSVLEEKIMQRVNFNHGSSRLSTDTAAPVKTPAGKMSGSAGRTAGTPGLGSAGGSNNQSNKVVNAPVTAIVEIQNGIEKKLSEMAQYAAVAKRNNKSKFNLSEPLTTPAAGKSEDMSASRTIFDDDYYAVAPSLFAAAFDNGHVLLLCVTSEGAWILSHLTSESSGIYSITALSVRLPCFFLRLWTHFHEDTTYINSSGLEPGKLARQKAPRQLLIVADSTLFVADEEQHVAAIACNGGTIALVRVPGLEPLAAVSTYEYDAVGSIITLRWAASTARHLITPDLLIAAGEDDTLTALQLNTNSLFALVANSNAAQSSPHWFDGSPSPVRPTSANATFSSGDYQPSSSDTTTTSVAGGLLAVLEKKLFHKSWVSHMTLLPLVMPASATEGGLPRYLGCSIIAASYDHTASFWPIVFPVPNSSAKDSREASGLTYAGNTLRSDMNSSSNTDSIININNTNGTTNNNRYIIVDGPTAAYPLHNDLALSVHVAGSGTSFFLVSACCRGRVKLWSVALKQVV